MQAKVEIITLSQAKQLLDQNGKNRLAHLESLRLHRGRKRDEDGKFLPRSAETVEQSQ
jgi:hypothetical protein